ncbi:type II secretion system protein GspJ [Sandaracinobacteroides saxicola]|uniref:Type II secretion system protein J n=1 Tax=Sandaracinobacteroides saxicola TaxID=2759707 RepID=A0A7G5IEE9_9SPHN|nr:type II secretion system protein GspJ [Sandaracinobacteroides saxicola]QMW21741.1 prepilin-type N-terminal cleavage/methylation domain-containing protein [Sandaracinobacteroides saxicola]
MRANGFTLVEMLVALALFSLIAGVATLLTLGSARGTAAAGVAMAGSTQLLRTRALLAADLAQAAQRPVLADNGAVVPAFVLTPNGFVLTRRGVAGVTPSMQRIAWGWNGRALVRQGWPRLDGAAPGGASIVLDAVRGVRTRVATDKGWQDGWQAETPDALPRAVELTLLLDGGRAVVMRLAIGL